MANVHSPRTPLTIELPAEVIEELRLIAHEKKVSLDAVILEACLAYAEPYLWEHSYKEWRRAHPNEPEHDFGIDGAEISPPKAPGAQA